jgi:hypothetical protein
MMEKVKTELAADESRSTPMKKVSYPRSSAAE